MAASKPNSPSCCDAHPAASPRRSAAAGLALGLLRAYKLALSPLFAGSCRYLPSCSDYAAEAIRRHGVVAGTWLGLKRLARCHPFGGSGFDPVPEAPRSRLRAPGSKLQAAPGAESRRSSAGILFKS